MKIDIECYRCRRSAHYHFALVKRDRGPGLLLHLPNIQLFFRSIFEWMSSPSLYLVSCAHPFFIYSRCIFLYLSCNFKMRWRYLGNIICVYFLSDLVEPTSSHSAKKFGDVSFPFLGQQDYPCKASQND